MLESARLAPGTGLASIAAANPFLVFEAKGPRVRIHRRGGRASEKETDPFEALRDLLRRYAVSSDGPFAGGAIGYVGYEAKNLIEPRLSRRAKGDLGLPDIYFMFFDRGIVWNHERRVMTAFAPTKKAARKIEKNSFFNAEGRSPSLSKEPKKNARVKSSLGRVAFMEAVRKAKGFIRAGEIYQANLSRRLDFSLREDPIRIYERLRRINPSPFFGILDADSFQILSGSPERLLKLTSNELETRPIAGTRSRGKNQSQDAALSKDLLSNTKETAEHVMLVDLERNDLGRVSEYGSVRVDEFMTIEDYSHVKHIVSSVRSRLRKDCDALDAFKAFFPGGTITGAPKVRCMEIIDALEPVARGPYTGSLGYFGFNGDMDFNIIIRSLVVTGGRGYLQTGAGIVADSVPRKEYEETVYKAEAVLRAVFG